MPLRAPRLWQSLVRCLLVTADTCAWVLEAFGFVGFLREGGPRLPVFPYS